MRSILPGRVPRTLATFVAFALAVLLVQTGLIGIGEITAGLDNERAIAEISARARAVARHTRVALDETQKVVVRRQHATLANPPPKPATASSLASLDAARAEFAALRGLVGDKPEMALIIEEVYQTVVALAAINTRLAARDDVLSQNALGDLLVSLKRLTDRLSKIETELISKVATRRQQIATNALAALDVWHQNFRITLLGAAALLLLAVGFGYIWRRPEDGANPSTTPTDGVAIVELDQAPVAVLSIDSSGQVTTANAAAHLILGCAPYELIGRPLTHFITAHVDIAAAVPGRAQRVQVLRKNDNTATMDATFSRVGFGQHTSTNVTHCWLTWPHTQGLSDGETIAQHTGIVDTESTVVSWQRRAEFYAALLGARSIEELGKNALSYFANAFSLPLGAFYCRCLANDADNNDEGQDKNTNRFRREMRLIATHAFAPGTEHSGRVIPFGQGLIGQAAADARAILVRDVPNDYVKIATGIGQSAPLNLLIVPCIHEREVVAVIELGTFVAMDENTSGFVKDMSADFGRAVAWAQAAEQLGDLLQDSRTRAADLARHADELQSLNDLLAKKTQSLETAELRNNQDRQVLQTQKDELSRQREQLREVNVNLDQQHGEMQNQATLLARQNANLELVQHELREKADELERASEYKSQFISTMTHELRTPLNSMIILAQILAQNENQHLDDKETRFAGTIYKSAQHFNELITDVLDLAKSEAGKLVLCVEDVNLRVFTHEIEELFRPAAIDKGISLDVSLGTELPDTIHSDSGKIRQVVNNLLSNAIKFTSRGNIELIVATSSDTDLHRAQLPATGDFISIKVRDSGIGIAQDRLDKVFEAFEQESSETHRQYGGTGLGLAIARQLAIDLGGMLFADSEMGHGSTFVLVLPHNAPKREDGGAPLLAGAASVQSPTTPENAPGHYGVKTAKKETAADDHQSQSTAAIPSGPNAAAPQDTTAAAREPVGEQPRILLVEDDPAQAVMEERLLSRIPAEVVTVHLGRDAIKVMKERLFSCLVVDLSLPDMDGDVLLKRLREIQTNLPPVIIYSGYELGEREKQALGLGSFELMSKGDQSPTALSAKVKELLQKPAAANSVEKSPKTDSSASAAPDDSVESTAKEDSAQAANIPKRRRTDDRSSRAKSARTTILVVDDDMRTVYALSRLLENMDMTVETAQSGEAALSKLKTLKNVDLLLTDVMMPGMTGIELIAKIRNGDRYADIPIVALTANTSTDTREQCFQSGANDFMSKPIEPRLFARRLGDWIERFGIGDDASDDADELTAT